MESATIMKKNQWCNASEKLCTYVEQTQIIASHIFIPWLSFYVVLPFTRTESVANASRLNQDIFLKTPKLKHIVWVDF